MEYNIINLEILSNSDERTYLEKHLNIFIKKMSILPKIYRKSKFIDIKFQRIEDNRIDIDISAKLNTGIININKTGDSIQEIIPELFDKYTQNISEELKSIRSQYSIDQKNTFIKLTNKSKEELVNLNENQKNELFNSLIPCFEPNLQGYIKRRILLAKHAKLKALSNLDYKDVISEVVLRVYPKFVKDIKDIKNLNLWLIKYCDDFLNEIIDHYTKENVSYEELVNQELGQLEEEYTVDAGGDLVMIEDLDEYETSLGVEEFILTSKGDNDFIDKLDTSSSSLKEKFYDELIKLPLRYQSIYDLYFIENLNFDEISIIKNIDPVEVEAIIISIKDLITEKLFN